VRAPGAPLLAQGHDQAETVCRLEPGFMFDVLDVQGRWAWGSCGVEGPSGYIALDRLEKD